MLAFLFVARQYVASFTFVRVLLVLFRYCYTTRAFFTVLDVRLQVFLVFLFWLCSLITK